MSIAEEIAEEYAEHFEEWEEEARKEREKSVDWEKVRKTCTPKQVEDKAFREVQAVRGGSEYSRDGHVRFYPHVGKIRYCPGVAPEPVVMFEGEEPIKLAQYLREEKERYELVSFKEIKWELGTWPGKYGGPEALNVILLKIVLFYVPILSHRDNTPDTLVGNLFLQLVL